MTAEHDSEATTTGKVLSSGSGEGGGITFPESQRSAQIFDSPYLFKPDGTLAPRPSIASAPSRLAYGQSFTVQTPSGVPSVAKTVMVGP